MYRAPDDNGGGNSGVFIRIPEKPTEPWMPVNRGYEVQINDAGTVSTKVPAATQAYDTAPLALAALPSADAGNVAIGYIAIANNAAAVAVPINFIFIKTV